MMQANLIDSDQFKGHRRISYSKLCATIELLSKASTLKKLDPVRSETLVAMLT